MLHFHIAEGYGDPNISGMVRLEQVVREINSAQAKGRGPSKRERLPITPEFLRELQRA